jgi:hypothetical protein
MGQTILQEGLQVIFRFGSYEAPSEAAQVLLAILEGMRTWEKRQMQAGRGPHPCLVIINEASRFFPDEIGHSIVSDDLAMATRLMRHFLSCLQAQGEYGIFFSLVTRKVTGMHEGALSQCSLWLLKHVRASEVQTLCALIHLDPEALSVLQQQVLLIDIMGSQAFAITPRPTSSIQEEDDAPLSHVFTPSLTAPLPRGTTASPSESWRETTRSTRPCAHGARRR